MLDLSLSHGMMMYVFLPGTCGWIFKKENDFVWQKGRNMSDGTGYEIIMDHTLGTAAGYFLYITEQPSEISGPAVMISKALHNAFLGCTMNFWYATHYI